MKPRLLGAALIGSVGLAACAVGGESHPTLDAIRAATEKYRDVEVALADGYVRDWLDTCETPYHMGLIGQSGAMGIHYLRQDLLEIGQDATRLDVAGTHTDFLQPAILVYEPRPNGSVELVAVQNMVSAAAWEANGNAEPPSFQGVPYEYAEPDAGMMTDALYDRHIWLFRENPDGLFAQYNPRVTCEHHEFDMPMIHPPDAPMEHP
ncbi:MAG: hypothetical protein WD766_15740 [Gemmatimonadota bacterium]